MNDDNYHNDNTNLGFRSILNKKNNNIDFATWQKKTALKNSSSRLNLEKGKVKIHFC